jgi:hypothetical protein
MTSGTLPSYGHSSRLSRYGRRLEGKKGMMGAQTHDKSDSSSG